MPAKVETPEKVAEPVAPPKIAAPKVETPVVEPDGKNESRMFDLLRRMMLAAIGAAVIAEEEIEALVNRLVERGEIAEKDGRKLVKEMNEKRKTRTSNLGDDLSKNVESVLKRMNISSKSDVEALDKKLNDLSLKIDGLKKP